MNIYADTSWWLAYKRREDAHHDAAIALFDRVPDARILWTQWHRVEVFNSLRQAEYRKVVPAGAAREVIRALEQEIRIGYWTHVEFNWTDAVRVACELSAEHSLRREVRSMDLFHVAVATEVAADAFLSFDHAQNAFARAAGFQLIKLNQPKRR